MVTFLLPTFFVLASCQVQGEPALSWVKNRGGADRNSFLADVFTVTTHRQEHTHTHTLTTAIYIIESVDYISWDERDAPLTQYITNAGMTSARYIHYQAF